MGRGFESRPLRLGSCTERGTAGPADEAAPAFPRRSAYTRAVLRVPVVLSLVVVVAGLILVLTVGTLLGALLIVGGVGGLGWSMAPAVVDRIVRWLSIGR